MRKNIALWVSLLTLSMYGGFEAYRLFQYHLFVDGNLEKQLQCFLIGEVLLCVFSCLVLILCSKRPVLICFAWFLPYVYAMLNILNWGKDGQVAGSVQNVLLISISIIMLSSIFQKTEERYSRFIRATWLTVLIIHSIATVHLCCDSSRLPVSVLLMNASYFFAIMSFMSFTVPGLRVSTKLGILVSLVASISAVAVPFMAIHRLPASLFANALALYVVFAIEIQSLSIWLRVQKKSLHEPNNKESQRSLP